MPDRVHNRIPRFFSRRRSRQCQVILTELLGPITADLQEATRQIHDYTLVLVILCKIAHFSERKRDAMSSNFERVTALIKELLALNRAESARTLEPRTVIELERRKSKRKRIRQELVQVLGLHDRTKA